MIILALGLLSGCVTQKSRQDQSKIGRFYHNVTSQYNGWFNANELLEASVVTLKDQHQDNFNDILPIYEYAAVDNADAVKADLDNAIKKVSIVVRLHEFSDWADDCYLLIGKAHYLKKDYESAENAFEFYMDEFLPDGKRANKTFKRKNKASSNKKRVSSSAKEANKRKKELAKVRKKAEKERKAYNKELRRRKKKGLPTDDLVRPGTTRAADGTTTIPTSEIKKYQPTAKELKAKAKAEGEQSGLFIHESVYDEAVLWLAKSYIERENWTSADYQLRRLESDDIVPKKVYEELPVARAYYHMKRENYPQVIPFLDQAIERASRRADKARYAFIIAQLYERAGQVDKSAAYYAKCLDLTNKYEMELNTRLSMIRSEVRAKTMSHEEAQSKLEKMTRDEKNTSYAGKIYYFMATLSVDKNDIPGAIAYLEKSVEEVGSDQFQAVESHYLLATLYMQRLMYVEAEQAYKSCAAIMKETDPRYKMVKKFADNLRDIAINLNVISLQDSLLMLSYKTDDELKVIARQIKKQRQQEAEEAAARAKTLAQTGSKGLPAGSGAFGAGRADMASLGGGSPAGAGQSRSPQGIFWAYDQKNSKKFRREFEKTWGNIALTDYWRVSSKATQYASTAEATTQQAESEVGLFGSEIEDFFKDVPKSDSARAICHSQIRKSMLLLGQLYRERLEDFTSSINILESLLSKYPDAPEKLEAYYQLYLSALSAADHERAEKYKDLIISQYPSSRFAKVLSDPNFAASQRSEFEKLKGYYDDTYVIFEAGNHDEVLERIRNVDELYGGNNVLMAKFDLLKAMSMGAKVGKEAYIDGLKHVVARYPNSDEERKARDMLLLLGEGGTGKAYGESGLEKANFTVEHNALHFVVVYVQNQDEVSLTDTKIAIADFHKKYFQNDNLKMASLVFDPSKNHSLVLIRSFTTKDKAMDYYKTALRNTKEFLPAKAVFEIYPITQKNYREVIRARTLSGYKEFFENNYK